MAQFYDMREIPRSPWPHWTSLRVNTCELFDPTGAHQVRVVCFERLEPGGTTQLSADFVPRHRNSYDVLYVNLALPLPDSGGDPAEPLGGDVSYRPECLLTEASSGMIAMAPVTDRVMVNIYLHVTGPSGAPLVTLDQISKAVTRLDHDQPGRIRHERGEYVEQDGTVREALEVCWETAMGSPFVYPDPPPLNIPVTFPIQAYPWCPSQTQPGVEVKSFAQFNATGPSLKFVRLDKRHRLGPVTLDKHRFVAVLAGAIRYDDNRVGDQSVLLGTPAEKLGAFEADERSLLWVVDWYNAETSPLAAW